VTDLGYTEVPAGATYPPGQHPPTYCTVNLESGRILYEYQIVYITHGKGVFWSDKSGTSRIRPGSVFLLFPGIRHHYRPNNNTGWNEQWIGFSGNQSEQLMQDFFSPERPVINVGLNADLHNLFITACTLAKNESFGFRPIIAAKTMEIMARVHALSRGEMVHRPASERLIRETCTLLTDQFPTKFDFNIHALNNGMSYSSFRRLFKQFTGLAPNQYLLDLKIGKARNLLINTSLQIKQISDACGFENHFYFSRIFKRRTNLSPLSYRKKFVAKSF